MKKLLFLTLFVGMGVYAEMSDIPQQDSNEQKKEEYKEKVVNHLLGELSDKYLDDEEKEE